MVDKPSPTLQEGIGPIKNVLHHDSWVRFVTENVSSTILFFDADSTSVLLCTWDSFFVIDFDFSDGKQDSVPYMWKVMFTCVPIESGLVNSSVKEFIDSSYKAVPLPTCYGNVSTDVLWPVLDWC